MKLRPKTKKPVTKLRPKKPPWEQPSDPKVIANQKRQIWWDGTYDGYWRQLLGPINWANPEHCSCWTTEESALINSAYVCKLQNRWAKVFDPDGKLVASFDRNGMRNDGGPQPRAPRSDQIHKPKKTVVLRKKAGR